MPWSQQEVAGQPETNVSVPQQGGQTDASRDGEVADYDLDVDYKPEGSEPDIKAVNEEEENSNAEYVKMELHSCGTLCQMTVDHKVVERIKRVHQA